MEPTTAENGWINTLDVANPDLRTTADRILNHNRYLTLSTCSSTGVPWVSPLLFAYDELWHLYWSSAIASRHSHNLDHNKGKASIVIFDSTASPGDIAGLYLEGIAVELEPEQVQIALEIMDARSPTPQPRNSADYLSPSPRRMYQFQPQNAWITGKRIRVGTCLVDTRLQVNIPYPQGISPQAMPKITASRSTGVERD